MNEFCIYTDKLRKDYDSLIALAGINLRVRNGSIYGLLGRNGAGKTTTVKIILGLSHPTAGGGLVLGEELGKENLLVKARIGYVSEDRGLYGGWSVGQAAAFCRACYPNWDCQLEKKLMEIFELPVKAKISQLSQGMKGQLALVLAMGHCPELLVLDEPTNGLDPVIRQQFYSMLVEEVAARGQTVLLSTHNLQEVERVADTVGLLVAGRLILQEELDILRDAHLRVRIAFADAGEELLKSIPGVLSVARDGRGFVATVDGGQQTIARLQALPHTFFDTAGMSLEDIFLAYSSPSLAEKGSPAKEQSVGQLEQARPADGQPGTGGGGAGV